MTLTVACVWVKSNFKSRKRRYRVEYVEKLHAMVARHLDQPFRMVCLTDRPHKLPPYVEGIKIKRPRGPYQGWWAKVNLFNPDLPLGDRILYLDLDVLVVGALDAIADYPARFAIAPTSASRFPGKDGRKTVPMYNSGVMGWDHGVHADIYRDFKPEAMTRLWGDQDLIAEKHPDLPTFPAEWFRRITDEPPPWPPETKVVMCIRTKNRSAAKQWPWFADLWG